MKESVRALAAWDAYWALGPSRTLVGASEQTGASYYQVKVWAKAFDWDGRVRARIAADDEAREQRRQQRILESEDRLTMTGREVQQIGRETLDRLNAEHRIGAVAAVQALLAGAKLELRGLRQPESITAQQVTGPEGGPVEVTHSHDVSFSFADFEQAFADAAGVAADRANGAAESVDTAQPDG